MHFDTVHNTAEMRVCVFCILKAVYYDNRQFMWTRVWQRIPVPRAYWKSHKDANERKMRLSRLTCQLCTVMGKSKFRNTGKDIWVSDVRNNMTMGRMRTE
jgi:hypothetical protein